jgi:hypothetical protein
MKAQMAHNGSARTAFWAVAAASAFVTATLLAMSPLLVATGAADDGELVDSVDPEMIRATITSLQDFGSREFHLESSKDAAEFLLAEFLGLGIPAVMQPFAVGDIMVSNVVATLQGDEDDDGMYLFGAHYDSSNRAIHDLSSAENLSAPGADDDASGVAAVLEMARVLAGSSFSGTVKFVMFGAEEMGFDDTGGCAGSYAYAVRESASNRLYAGTAVLDMVGYRMGSENKATILVNSLDYELAKQTERAVHNFGIDLEFEVLLAPSVDYSDHWSFWQAGIPSMLVIEELDEVTTFPMNPYYHTSSDTVDTLSIEQVAAVTQALLGGLLMTDERPGSDALLFGTVLMSAAIVSVAAIIYFRRMRGRAQDDE